jgi:CheY-like chemotaxis protein
MKKKLNCILFVDDNPADNYYHQLIIKKMNIANIIEVAENGLKALEFLKNKLDLPPELIFLDINMPKMNGWEFLEEYKSLESEKKANIVILLLTTSTNPDDINRAKQIEEVTGFQTKPLTEEIMDEILNEYFQDYL